VMVNAQKGVGSRRFLTPLLICPFPYPIDVTKPHSEGRYEAQRRPATDSAASFANELGFSRPRKQFRLAKIGGSVSRYFPG